MERASWLDSVVGSGLWRKRAENTVLALFSCGRHAAECIFAHFSLASVLFHPIPVGSAPCTPPTHARYRDSLAQAPLRPRRRLPARVRAHLQAQPLPPGSGA